MKRFLLLSLSFLCVCVFFKTAQAETYYDLRIEDVYSNSVSRKLLKMILGDRPPRLGDHYSSTMMGAPADELPGDRDSITAVNFGIYADDEQLSPFAALLINRNRNNGRERVRGIITGLYNDICYNFTPDFLRGGEVVLAFENMTVPFPQSEFIEGDRITKEELKLNQVRLGIGVGYHRPIAVPVNQDNAFEIALTYEPGLISFERGDKTDTDFILPHNTYEGRVHLRLIADAIERNHMKLPQNGFMIGLDGLYGLRSNWSDWGGSYTGLKNGAETQEWAASSFYAVNAAGFPMISSERHRLVTSVYGGIGKDLDRFSALRIGGEFVGTTYRGFSTSRYAIFNLEHRYEFFPFLFSHLRGSLAWIERPRFNDDGLICSSVEALHSIGCGITSGFLWKSSLEIGYGYNFGILRNKDGKPEKGGPAFSISWSKDF